MIPRYKKLLSMLLTAAMVLNIGLTPVFAEGTTPPGVSGVCTHHTEHTEDCGYQQGTPCTHEHKVNDGEADREGPLGGTDDCYKVELTCKLIEGDAPEIATDSEATLDSGTAHIHGDSCYTKIDNCKHTHDDTCGYTPDSPCTYDTASCAQCSPGDKPAEKVCTCEPAISASDAGHDEDCPLYTKPVCTCAPVDSGEPVHGMGCPLYTTPALSEAVKALIATANSALALTTNKVGNTVTYGDTITFTANVSIPTTKARAASANTVDFYCGDTKLNDSPIPLNESGGTGTATFAYDTTSKKIPAGEDIEITAEYGGSGNLNGVTQTVNVTLTKKPLTGGTITAGQSKPYDGNNSFSGIAATFAPADGVLGSDAVTATVDGTTSSSAVGTSLPLTVTSATLGAADAGFYLPPTDLSTFTGKSVAITKITPTITVETDKSSDLGGKEIMVTVKITNPTGAASGFPAAGEITITPTNATEKTALTQQGTTGVYTATYTLGAYSAGAKAKFVATVPSETSNYNANTTGGAAEVEILDKYTPTVTIEVSKTWITYGESVTLTATVGKNGQASPLAGTVQFIHNIQYFGDPVTIDANGKATLTVGKETMTIGSELHRFDARFIPEIGSDYKIKTSGNVKVAVNKANLSGVVTIDGTPKYGETLTANTFALSGVEGDNLGEFNYEWRNTNSFLGAEKTYTIQAADIGKEIYVAITPKSGNYDGERSATVTPTRADATLTITDDLTKTYDGTAVSEPATTQTGSTGAVTFQWYSGDVKLDSAPKNAGSYTVKAILAQNATHVGVTATRDFVISKAALAPSIDAISAQDYTGSQIKPTVAVKISSGGTALAPSEYTVEYGTNVDAGTGSVTVKAAVNGNYTFADVSANFTISKVAYTGMAVTGTKLVIKNKTQAGAEFDLSTLSFPAGFKDKTYGAVRYGTNTDGVLTGTPGINGTRITFDVGSVVKDKSGVIEVVVGSKNYLDYTVKITVTTVDKIPVTITGTAATGLTYNGSKQQGYTTISVEGGMVPISELNFVYTGTAKDGTTYNAATAPTKAGNYKLVVSVKANNDTYIGTGSDILFGIGQKELNIKADDKTILIGEPKPSYTATPTGLVIGETIDRVTFTDTAANTNSKGSFIITPTGTAISGGGNDNYIITYETGTLTINMDVSAIDTAIVAANSAKSNVITDDRRADKVSSGAKFVTSAEMKALTDAINTATAAKSTVTTKAEAEQAAKALNDAVDTFKAAIKTGTYISGDGSSGGGSTGGGGSSGGGSTGGGGSSGGESSTGGDNITPPTTSEQPSTVQTNAKTNTHQDGNVTAKVDDKDILKAIKKAQKSKKQNGIAITLNVKTKENTNSLEVSLSASTITALTNAKVMQFTINNGLSTITFDLAALKALSGGDVILTVSKVDVKALSAEAQNAIASRPVFRFGVTVGGKAVTDFKGGRVGLQMPYTRITTEQTGNLCGVYVDVDGKVNWLEASSYDPITGTMLISVQHFSIYGIGYKQSTPKFTDVDTHWAKNDIDFVLARGLISGTSRKTFAPDTSITRGKFVTALGKLAGVDTKKYSNTKKHSNTKFIDVKTDAYYAPYVAWANANNIVNGTSDTTFGPNKAISRQEIAVMLVNYSKAISYKLPSVHPEIRFVDANSISPWAKDAVKQMQMAGILMGKSGDRLDPTATVTRAEVSTMLRRYVELVVNTETAEGWAINESGQWMYIQDGKRVTGEKTIDGKSYTFDSFGVTTALPPERKYLIHIVQKGESFWSIARKYKVSMFELVKVNGKNIFSVIRPNEELKIPQ